MKLYPYQQQYLQNLPTKAIMHADLGTGKTVMALAHYQKHILNPYLRGIVWELQPLLIVAPASKVRTGDWEREAKEWFGEDHTVDITVISYEKLARTGKKYPNWFEYSPQHGGTRYAVIADECHRIKSPSSKANRALLEITAGGEFFIGLSGTPIGNQWFDFAGYSKLFGFTKGITEFKNKYCNIQTYKGWPEIVGYRNVDELEQQWAAISRSLSRAEATELPDKQFITINIPKVPKEYFRLKLERTDKLGEFIDNPSKLAHSMRQSTTETRMDHLDSILSDTTDNVVVLYNYISERKAILDLLKKNYKDKNIIRYDGEQHDTLPESDSDIKNTVMVAHYKAASAGLNLQWANVMIFFSLTYSYLDYEQAKGRIWRHGQTKKCVYYLFRVRGTIDDSIAKCLSEKRDFSEKLWYNGLQEAKKAPSDA